MFSTKLRCSQARAKKHSSYRNIHLSQVVRVENLQYCLRGEGTYNLSRRHLTNQTSRRPCPPWNQPFQTLESYSRSFQSKSGDLAVHKYKYRIAAAYSGKGREFIPAKHHFNFDSSARAQWLGGQPIEAGMARVAKLPSGQDSFFISQVGSSGAAAFGVADGVGGYMDHGIDSAAFAHGMCNYMAKSAADYPYGNGDKLATGHLRPQDLLQIGYDQVCKDKSIRGGGSTACIGVAEPQGSLGVANLGDSGFLHIRLNAINYYSKPQIHAFNTPFQLSTLPPKMLAQIENYGGSAPFCDMPKDATISNHELRHGDVLVFATDGLWDNLTSQEVLRIVSENMITLGGWTAEQRTGVSISEALAKVTEESSNVGPEGPLQTSLAVAITRAAKWASMNTKRDGPFAKEVQKSYPSERFTGGKVDDICVVVAIPIEGGAIGT